MRVEVKNVKEKRKERQNQEELKASLKNKSVLSKCKKKKQLADPTFIQSLNCDSQAVEAMNLESISQCGKVYGLIW